MTTRRGFIKTAAGMTLTLTTLSLVVLLALPVLAQTGKQPSGLPPMGWNSWNWFGKAAINEVIVRGVIDAMATNGLKQAGYTYVVIDGGWRDTKLGPDGELLAHPVKFPGGIKVLADYAHAKGLKLGLHTVPGTHDCGGDKVGAWGHEATHLKQFVDWGLDFVKLDKCGFELQGGWNEDLLRQTYTKWHRLIEASGRDIVFSISAYRFRDWYPATCRMARTTPDINCRIYRGASFDKTPQSVMGIARLNNQAAAFAGKGYWNDPDMLVVGEQGLNGSPGMTVEEQKTHFALWCMMTAPLILGNDPRDMQPYEREILLNRDCIAVDQDPTEQGRQAKVSGDIELWVKHLADKRLAILLLNRQPSETKAANVAWKELGLSGAVQVRDLLAKQDLGVVKDSFARNLPPHGCAFLLLASQPSE